ncbi:methionine ABC transporter ATP-binding protein [Massilia niastensis]|uniref:methionine ABC transporter ATP-binding protein n=1 Tax=Massilia niastensis TaxID=544911 RepID=UPI0003698BC8|nr:methionine ABC transporter ATP-binding protein [Massilia niastensis]
MDAVSSPLPAGRAPLVRIDNASKAYLLPGGRRVEALRAVSLEIRRGEIFGVIGRSGAGKSTLLRLINLLERPDSGSVTVAGQELTRLGQRDLRDARRRIGMIFQQANLLQNATVFENVAFPLRLHGALNAPRLAARVAECLEWVGLADQAGSYPARLSGAQKQRVAIARALAGQPEVLLCDEPTSALDPETTRALLDTLRDIHQRLGATIVIASHELPVLGSLCHRVAVVEDGRIAEQFALGDRSAPRKTALGRELAFYGTEGCAAVPGALHA